MIAAAVGIVLGSQASPALSRLLSARWTVASGVAATAATYVAYAWLDGRTPSGPSPYCCGSRASAWDWSAHRSRP